MKQYNTKTPNTSPEQTNKSPLKLSQGVTTIKRLPRVRAGAYHNETSLLFFDAHDALFGPSVVDFSKYVLGDPSTGYTVYVIHHDYEDEGGKELDISIHHAEDVKSVKLRRCRRSKQDVQLGTKEYKIEIDGREIASITVFGKTA